MLATTECSSATCGVKIYTHTQEWFGGFEIIFLTVTFFRNMTYEDVDMHGPYGLCINKHYNTFHIRNNYYDNYHSCYSNVDK